jgi:hypothetical protein
MQDAKRIITATVGFIHNLRLLKLNSQINLIRFYIVKYLILNTYYALL